MILHIKTSTIDLPVHNINKGTNYSIIQAAIDDASPDDEIHVDTGTYVENVEVNKRLTLCGIDTGTGMTVVDAKGNGNAITLAADGIIIEGFIAINSNQNGIYVISNNNTIRNNIVSNNICGICCMESSSNNTIIGNNVSNNDIYGIELSSSSNNTIYNNYFNNIKNPIDDSVNIWNITPTAGTNIIGGPWIGGNYWSDYTGTDSNGDGIGDTPYPIPGGNSEDRYPLMAHWNPQ